MNELDRTAETAAGLTGAFAGIGLAGWLSTLIPFPGSAPRPGVVGHLARYGLDKSAENGLFFGAVLLAPLLAWLATRLARRHALPAAIQVGLAAGAGLSVALGLWAGSRSPIALVAVPIMASFVVPILAPLVHLRLSRLAASQGFWSGGWDVARDIGLAPLAAAISLAIFTLAVGPRVAAPIPLFDGALRVAAALLGSGLAIGGLMVSLSALGRSPGAVAVAMRHGTWLLLARLAPEVPAVVFTAVGLAGLGFVWSLIRHHEVDPAALRVGAPRFFAFVFLPVMATALIFHHDVHGDLDLFHSGEWLTPGMELKNGEAPYRDVYLQHGLMQNALRPWATFVALGETYEADALARNLTFALAHAAFLLLLLATLRSRVLAVLLSLAIASPPLVLNPRFMFFFLALALAMFDLRRARDELGRAVPRRSRRLLLWSGAAAGVALFHSLDSGLYAIASIATYLSIDAMSRRSETLRERLAAPVRFVTGVGLGAAPFVAYLVAVGAGGAFVENARGQLALQLSVWGLPFPTLTGPISLGDPRVLALATAAAIIFAFVAVTLRAGAGRCTDTDWPLLLLALAGAVLFRTALGRSDDGHLAYASAMLWPILALVGEASLRRVGLPGRSSLAPLRRVAPLGLLAVYLVGAHAPLFALARQWLRLSEVLPTRAGGGFCFGTLPRLGRVLIPEEQARALASLESWLDERLPPGAPVFEFSNMGAVHFLLGRDCPTRFVQPVYAATPQQQAELIADLERSRPRFMITSSILGFEVVDGVPLEERLPAVAAYLAAHYRPYADEPFGLVFVRADD